MFNFFVAEATYVRRLATEAILQPHIFHFILKYIKTFLRCILITLLFLFKNSLAFINKIKTPISVKGYWHFFYNYFFKACKYSAHSTAALRPSAKAHSTTPCPRRASPAANTPAREVSK